MTLEGPPPAVRVQETPKVETELEKAHQEPSEPADQSLGVGFAAVGLVGASFGQLLVVGGGLQLEMRMPFWERRLGARTGVEFVHHSGSGKARFGEGTLDAKTRIAGFLIPFEVIFAYVTTSAFEATIRGGGDVRFERGVVTIGGDSPGGISNVGFSGRVGLDAIFKIDAGHITVGATLGGLGSSASRFSTPNAALSGSLLSLRGDVSYGFWF